jgi:hypothetical protein
MRHKSYKSVQCHVKSFHLPCEQLNVAQSLLDQVFILQLSDHVVVGPRVGSTLCVM